MAPVAHDESDPGAALHIRLAEAARDGREIHCYNPFAALLPLPHRVNAYSLIVGDQDSMETDRVVTFPGSALASMHKQFGFGPEPAEFHPDVLALVLDERRRINSEASNLRCLRREITVNGTRWSVFRRKNVVVLTERADYLEYASADANLPKLEMSLTEHRYQFGALKAELGGMPTAERRAKIKEALSLREKSIEALATDIAALSRILAVPAKEHVFEPGQEVRCRF